MEKKYTKKIIDMKKKKQLLKDQIREKKELMYELEKVRTDSISKNF